MSVPSIGGRSTNNISFQDPILEKEAKIAEKLGEITLRAWQDPSFLETLKNHPETVIQEYELPLGEEVKVSFVVDSSNEKSFVIPLSPFARLEAGANLDLAALANKHATILCTASWTGECEVPASIEKALVKEKEVKITEKLGEITLRTWQDPSFLETLKNHPEKVIKEYELPIEENVKVNFLIDLPHEKHFVFPLSPLTKLEEDATLDLAALAAKHATILCTTTWGGSCRPPVLR